MMLFLSELFPSVHFLIYDVDDDDDDEREKVSARWLTDIFCRMRYVGDDETRRRFRERNGKLVIIINAR